ncbi:MAG: LarC family nickel insertion protein, partial [Lentisphaerae bacterium]|nr:LarC family nickel insertion protein [Lentisphaerota bacterium]
ACNLDDLTPELVGALTEKMLASGALDVYVIPVQMKKQRPGMLLTVLCRADQRDGMLDLLFRESTTFGVRERLVQRAVLERRSVELSTAYGVVRAKVGNWRGQDIKAVPEYADCLAAAQQAGVPVAQVYNAALAGIQTQQVLKN